MREVFLEKISKAKTFEQVFDLANRAFEQRQEWGDDLTGSVAAYSKWSSAVFPVECDPEGALIGTEKMQCTDLLSKSLSAAKAFARELLAPLPATQSPLEGKEHWLKMSQRANEALEKVWDIWHRGPALHYVHGFEILLDKAGAQWDRAQEHTDWNAFCQMMRNPQNIVQNTPLDAHYEQSDPLLQEQWERASDHEDNFKILLDKTGAGFVQVSPAGGLKCALKGAHILAQSYTQISDLLGSEKSTHLNAGLEGILIGLCSENASAYFNPSLSLIAFPTHPIHVAHEWTHLVDYAVRTRGNMEQKKALKDLKQAPLAVKPDPLLQEQYYERIKKDQQIILGFLLHEKGAPESKVHLVQPVNPLTPMCSTDFFESAVLAVKKGVPDFIKFLNKHMHHGATINLDGAMGVYQSIVNCTTAPAESVCVFLKEAQRNDAFRQYKKSYYADPKELIARVAESHFYSKGVMPSVAQKSNGNYNPKGREALDLSCYYDALMQQVLASPTDLMSPTQKERFERKNAQKLGGVKQEDIFLRSSITQQLQDRRSMFMKDSDRDCPLKVSKSMS